MSLKLAGRLFVLLTFQIIYQAQCQHEEQNMKTQPCIIGKMFRFTVFRARFLSRKTSSSFINIALFIW